MNKTFKENEIGKLLTTALKGNPKVRKIAKLGSEINVVKYDPLKFFIFCTSLYYAGKIDIFVYSTTAADKAIFDFNNRQKSILRIIIFFHM
jgi:hypothetical protein